MQLTRRTGTTDIYLYLLCILAVSLPLSIWVTSLSQILLLVNWILDGHFRQKWRKIISNKALLLFLGIYGIHLIGLLYTQSENLSYALHDLKIKLPMLVLPVIIATTEIPRRSGIRILISLFISAVSISTLISFAIYLGIIPYEYYDIREISIFVSHIRLSLMINLSIFAAVYYLYLSPVEFRFRGKMTWIFALQMIWQTAFIFILKSFTGIVIFFCISILVAFIFSGRITQVAPRFIFRVLILTVPLLIASFITRSIDRFYTRENVDFSSLEELTPYGNPYTHDTLCRATENGNYVWIYISENEMQEAWNERSSIACDSLDHKNQRIKYTLIRYLTSKGLRKDRQGVEKLTKEDVVAIENGLANHIFKDDLSLYPRIYEIIWEIDGYLRGRDPSGHSVAQRIAYLKGARHIISHHPVIGVGTGDVQDTFDRYYEETGSMLKENNRRRAHNQFVTFILTFGFLGFTLIMLMLLLPVFLEKKWNSYLFLVFFTIALLSWINEDTLETQTGVTFFALFYSLLLLGSTRKKDDPQGGREGSTEYQNQQC